MWLKPAVDVTAYDNNLDVDAMIQNPRHCDALLIQSRGTAGITCDACASNPTRGPFTECRRTKGYYGGCCGNCRVQMGHRCSLLDWDEVDDNPPETYDDEENREKSSDDKDDEDVEDDEDDEEDEGDVGR